MMKKYIVFVLVICLLISGCSETTSKSDLQTDSIYDNYLGKIISLGMEKSAIDKIYSESNRSENTYFYEDWLGIVFKDGKSVSIILNIGAGDRWHTKGEITIGSDINDLIDEYGEPNEKISGGALGLGYEYRFEECVVRFFKDDDDKITMIMINKSGL